MTFQLILHCSIVLFLLLSSGLAKKEVDDPCYHKEKNAEGVCKLFPDCPTAVQDFKTNKIPPQICGFPSAHSTVPIVCCTGKPTIDDRGPSDQQRVPGDISKIKCKEYSQYVFKKVINPALLIPEDGDDPYITIKECGFKVIPLVVGGTNATRLEFPHMTAVGFIPEQDVIWACGGSLISERFVLTAAHCLSHRSLGDAKVVLLGVTFLDDKTSERQQIGISERIAHPQYSQLKHYNDIGLLKLEKNARMSTTTRPACLHTDYSIQYEKSIASGFGRIEYGGATSKYLLKVVLELYKRDECNQKYINAPRLDNGVGISDTQMLCAGSREELKDTCQGDSGGPLQIYHDDKRDKAECMYDIIGIVSFGKPCGITNNLPGVYTRVSNYIKWIEDIVWPSK